MKIDKTIGAALLLVLAAGAQAAQPESDEVKFPPVNSAWVKQGSFVNLENLSKMMPGLDRDQVQNLLGMPHFSEGFSVRTWNYIFDLRTGKGNEFATCQYQVQFDEQKKTSAMYWKDSSCAELAKVKPQIIERVTVAPAPVPAPAPAPAPAPERIVLDADALFQFGRGDLNGMLPEGRHRMDELVGKVQSSNVKSVKVQGHTDRLGSAAMNERLSTQRAQTVGDYVTSHLRQGGNDVSAQVSGMGSANPVVQCTQRDHAALVKCLAPNRRVEVQVEASR